jgi:ketosteroid isomerase-like protein
MSVTPSFPLITRRHLFRQTRALLAVSVIGDFPPLQAQSSTDDEIARVKSAEVAFNAAQNVGNVEGMFSLSLPDRTVYGPAGGALVEGWTDESKKRRQAEFDAGRKIDLRIDDLKVRVYENTAVTTFYRIGTVTEGGVTRQVHLRISGVWIRQSDGWKLAHRHESPY